MSQRLVLIFLVFIGLAVLFGGCSQNQISTPTPAPEQTLQSSTLNQSSAGSVVDASNQFALDIYSKYGSGDENIFFSPYSISSALAMTYEGARGETAEEIQSVFHFPDDNVRREGFKSLYRMVNNRSSESYTLHTANALWAREDYKFLDSYFNIIERYYGGKVTNLDFGKPEASAERINSWVEKQTNNKIKDLIPAGSISPMTKLVLTNAIYFKGKWLKQFNKTKTEKKEFHTGNNTVEVPMMYRRAEFNYTETKNLQVLELLYSGKEISMLVLLPKENNLETLEDSLTTQNLSKWRQSLEKQKVNVYLPRFQLETKYFMKNTLKEMGMKTAFTPKANFSGITGSQDLFINQIIHQAYVKVNEEGTEAAAATAVIGLTSAKPQETPTFNADHPFIFIIQQKETGNILFIGRLKNP